MKLYTKTGDDGTTGLFGGGRVRKNDARVDAYGAVDELNAWIGVVRAQGDDRGLDGMLASIQSDLFSLGAELATPDDDKAPTFVTDTEIVRMEQWIDAAEAELEPLTAFILPGGSVAAAGLHFARTVCRRAERAVVALSAYERVRPQAVIYLNRLGDLLFALARQANQRVGVADVEWTTRQGST